MVREAQVAEAEHGVSGLDGVVLPSASVPLDPRRAVDVIIETVLSQPPGEVTVVPTGPLTNLALAVRLEPRIVERVAEVVLMGGAYAGGNLTPVAEYNIAADPEAAAIVFGERWPVTMVGLDVTHQALAMPEVVRRIEAVGHRTRPLRHRPAGVLRVGLPGEPGVRGTTRARSVRRGVRRRSRRADHGSCSDRDRAAGRADHRDDGRRSPPPGPGGLHDARGDRYRRRALLGPGGRRAGTRVGHPVAQP